MGTLYDLLGALPDDDAEGLDQFLATTRQSRKRIRPEIEP